MNKIFILLCAVVFVSSCSRSIESYFDESRIEDDPGFYEGHIQDSLFTWNLTYIGMGSHYFIFESTFQNNSSDIMTIRPKDFSMDVLDGKVFRPMPIDDLVVLLEGDKKEIKKEKKKRTIWNVILTGLEFALSATQGAPLAENLLFSADPVAYIFDERSFYDRNLNSVDDEINYVTTMTLVEKNLLPGETITADLLFPIQPILSDVRLFFMVDRLEYEIIFGKKVFNPENSKR